MSFNRLDQSTLLPKFRVERSLLVHREEYKARDRSTWCILPMPMPATPLANVMTRMPCRVAMVLQYTDSMGRSDQVTDTASGCLGTLSNGRQSLIRDTASCRQQDSRAPQWTIVSGCLFLRWRDRSRRLLNQASDIGLREILPASQLVSPIYSLTNFRCKACLYCA